jgi:quinol monooxygenase YgiN
MAEIRGLTKQWEDSMQQPADAGQGEVNIVVTQRVLPGKESEYEALLRKTEAGTVAKDKGCLRYEWYRSETPQTYILLERWTDRAAVQAHPAAPHMLAIKEEIPGLAPEHFTFVRLTKQ